MYLTRSPKEAMASKQVLVTKCGPYVLSEAVLAKTWVGIEENYTVDHRWRGSWWIYNDGFKYIPKYNDLAV